MLACLSIDLAYLIGICMSEEENTSTVYSMDMDFYFTFIAQKGESVMVKWKMHPGQKQLLYANQTAS